MIWSTRQERTERLDICKACEHYKEETRSCGTLLTGDLVDVGKKRKVRTCGCVMPLKVKFKLSSCPLNKWQPSAKASKELRELFEKYKNEGRIPTEVVQEITNLYNETFEANKKVTNCGACFRDLMKELQATFENE